MNKDISIEVLETAKLAIEPDVPDRRRLHVKVGKKDTLAGIANRYKVSVADLKAWNGLDSDHVASGKSLVLHAPQRQAAQSGSHRQVASAAHGKKTVVTARAKTGSKTTVAKASTHNAKKAPPRITLASER